MICSDGVYHYCNSSTKSVSARRRRIFFLHFQNVLARFPFAKTREPMHKVQQCGGTFRYFCGPVWVKNKPISVPAIVKPFCTALEKGISNIEKKS